MIALIIIGIILLIAAFIYLGFYLWNVARKQYGYNIFGTGIIIRGIASLFCLTFAVIMSADGGSLVVWLIAAIILWLWTFLATWRGSNFFIALFSIIYQFIAVLFVFKMLNRIREEFS